MIELAMKLLSYGEFFLGWLVGIISVIATGFMKGLGRDLYTEVKKRILKEPTFVEVDRSYEPSGSQSQKYVWVPESKRVQKLQAGYKYNFEDAKRTVYFRKTSDGRSVFNEYLMIKPEHR